jgi:transglutaminase-like putative cysteine protease
MKFVAKSSLDIQLSVTAMRWMLMAQVISLLIHIPRLPWLLSAVLLLCVFWRIQILRGKWRVPGSYLKVMLATLGLIVLGLSFQKVTVNAAVSLLLLAYSLKLIELNNRKDGFLSLFLSYMVSALLFLFDTEIITALIVFSVCIITTCALIAMHRQDAPSPITLLKQSLTYWLSAIPLMLVFFVFFPRMAPLWSIDLGQNARTGLSDNISPGDIAELTQSDELVFRARFLEPTPFTPEGMYWRAFVLDQTDGRGWKRATHVGYHGQSIDWYGNFPSSWRSYLERKTPNYPYEVILEATQKSWLVALDGSLPEQEHVGLTQDFALQYNKPIRQTVRYTSTLPTVVNREQNLGTWRLKRELQLPANENPRTKALAESIWARTQDSSEFINEVLAYFKEQEFRYTLRPPRMGEKANDEFLFDAKRGFCAHFAGATALIARYAGIPARVVVGYLGGEWNEEAKYLTVRQYDAHAWTEVWIPEKGWVVIDPTEVVAPDRIEQGLAEAMKEEGSFLESSLFSPYRYQNLFLLNSMRQWFDEVNYQWSRRVVGYDTNKQDGVFSDLIQQWGRYTWLGVAFLVLSALLIPFIVWGLIFVARKVAHRKTPQQCFEGELISLAIGCKAGEPTLDSLSGFTARKLFDQLKNDYSEIGDEILALSRAYELKVYSSVADRNSQDWRQLLQRLRKLKRRIKKR